MFIITVGLYLRIKVAKLEINSLFSVSLKMWRIQKWQIYAPAYYFLVSRPPGLFHWCSAFSSAGTSHLLVQRKHLTTIREAFRKTKCQIFFSMAGGNKTDLQGGWILVWLSLSCQKHDITWGQCVSIVCILTCPGVSAERINRAAASLKTWKVWETCFKNSFKCHSKK